MPTTEADRPATANGRPPQEAAALPRLLRDLLLATGPSGSEAEATSVWRGAASQFAEVSADALGSSAARLRSPGASGAVALVGHIDEIGLIVTHIDEAGFLYFAGLGGWDPQVLVAQRVTVLTSGGLVDGVVARKPRYLMDPEERKRAPVLTELHIDIGSSSREESARRVQIGDAVVVASDPLELPGGRLVARALDNRIGSYIVLEALRRTAAAGAAGLDVVAIAAVQEEATFAGARTSAFTTDPSVAIVVDVTQASDEPDVDVRREGEHPLGSGPVLARGPVIDPAVHDLLVETAEEVGITHTVGATAGRTWTDADAVQSSRHGVRTGLVSVPIRHIHTPVEMASLHDVEATVRLVTAFLRRTATLGRPHAAPHAIPEAQEAR